MAEFPSYSSIPYNNPIASKVQFKTIKSNFDNLGEEKRRRKWLYTKRYITLPYEYITKANAATIWQFYLDRSGSYEAFNLFLEHDVITDHVDEYVGTGDGTTTVWNLPSKDGSTRTVYLNGSSQSASGVDYTYSAQGGADSADKITFVAAPSSGDRITYDFSGVLKIHCRFAEDYLSFENFHNTLINIGIQLQGLLNE